MATKLINPRNGVVKIRIGASLFHFPTNGSESAVKVKMIEQMVKITKAGGSFDYVAGYPKTGDALIACRKGLRPEQFPELMEKALEAA